MRIYILEKKNLPAYSIETHVIMAQNKIEMGKIAKPRNIDTKEFDIKVISKPGLIISNIY